MVVEKPILQRILKNFFNLYLAALGLHCCKWAVSSSGGYSLVAVCQLLIVRASLVAEHGL